MRLSLLLTTTVATLLCVACTDPNLSDGLFNQTGIGGTSGNQAGTGSTTNQTAGLVPGLPKGFQCPFIPNGFDPVGSIYRLDRKGTYFRVSDFSKDPVVTAGMKSDVKIGDYVFNDTQKASADLSVTFLKRVLPGLSGNANVNKEFLVDITVKDMHARVIYDREADHIRDRFSKEHTPRAGNRYFLVREAIFAGSVSYELRTKDLKQAGIKAKVDEVIDSSANATFADNGKKLLIKQTFKPPTQVCIKVAEIEINRRGGKRVVATAPLKTTDAAEHPEIKRIGTQ